MLAVEKGPFQRSAGEELTSIYLLSPEHRRLIKINLLLHFRINNDIESNIDIIGVLSIDWFRGMHQ